MSNQNQQEKKKQIIRKDGKNCLVEINSQSFTIGKVQFVFSKYDPNKPKGQRTTDRVVIYLDFSAALEFAQSILDGRFSKELVMANKKFQETNQSWDKDVVISMGGTANPKNRTDGNAESRILKAQLGTKNPVALIATSGPGSVNDKGLITPLKGARVDHSVMIPLSAKDIREIALMIKTHVEAYIFNEHVHNLWSYVPQQTDNQSSPANNGSTASASNANGYQASQPQPPAQSQSFVPADEELPF